MSDLTRRLREKGIECNEAADRIDELEAEIVAKDTRILELVEAMKLNTNHSDHIYELRTQLADAVTLNFELESKYQLGRTATLKAIELFEKEYIGQDAAELWNWAVSEQRKVIE